MASRFLRPALAACLAGAALAASAAKADEMADLFAAIEQAKKLEAARNYRAAAEQYKDILVRVPKVFGRNHNSIASNRDNLARQYANMAQYVEAEQNYQQSMEFREAKHGPNHIDVATSLNYLANLYYTTGKYAKAEPLFQRSLKIREANLPQEHPDVAQSLNNLATLYQSLGQYAKAEPHYLRSLTIFEAKPGADHIDVATSLNNLAHLYLRMDQYAKAEPLYQRSLRIREANLPPEHPDVAQSLNNLADLYQSMGQFAKAEPLFQRSLKIFEAQRDPKTPEVATLLNNLAALYRDMGQLAKAEPLYQRSLKIREAKLGPEHPQVAQTLTNLASLETTLGKAGEAAVRFERARRIVRRHVAGVLPLLSEREQATFLNEMDRMSLEYALSLALHSAGDSGVDSGTIELSAGWLANAKAVAQGSLAERAQLGRDARDPNLQETVKQVQTVRGELAALALTTAKLDQEAAYNKQVAQLAAQEQTLAKRIAAARGQAVLDDPWVSIAQIRGALPAGAVLIDIGRLDILQFAEATADKTGAAKKQKWLGQHYVAWIIPATGAGNVKVINLGPADRIEAAVAAYQKEIAAETVDKTVRIDGEVEAERRLAKPLGELTRLLLLPMREHVIGAKQLVLSPDGALWLVPWAALPTGEGKYAVERWQMRYVIAGREVALEKLRKPAARPGPPRIFADPDFDLPQRDAQAAFNAVFNLTGNPPVNRTTAKSTLPDDDLPAVRSSSKIGLAKRLPETASEAASVAPKLKVLTKEEPTSYLDRSAQEAVFKRLGAPRVLLMSTHGFFLPDQHTKSDNKDRLALTGDESKSKVTLDEHGDPLENPLLRCGLQLAGCNQRDKYTDTNLGDGILTGLEIVGTDLRGTELVVLSACETGLGQVNNGEGVAGLRQAFQIAGAQTIVSTLWQIPSKETTYLVDDFFTNLAAEQSRPEALRNAQLKMIKERRERGGAAHPFFWAAWTVTGPDSSAAAASEASVTTPTTDSPKIARPAEPKSPKSKLLESEYYPLRVGDSWEYEVISTHRSGRRSATTEKWSVTEVDARGAVLTTTNDGDSTMNHVSRLGIRADGIYGYRDTQATSQDGKDAKTKRYNPLTQPANQLLALKTGKPVTKGTKWKNDREVNENEYTLLSVSEAVTVSAGKYNAVHVESRTAEFRESMWYAPGVGVVKRAFTASDPRKEVKAVTWTLTKYKPAQ